MDVARGIGIVLVVFGHLERGLLDLGGSAHANVLQACDFVLYTTHMPLFFALAGRTTASSLGRRSRRRYLATRPRAILWPCLLWSAIFVSVQHLASGAMSVHHAVPFTALLLAPVVPIGIFWFLQSLFWAQCLAALMVGRAAILLGAALAADVAVTLVAPSGLGPGLVPLLLHLPFFAAGFLLAETGWRAPDWSRDRLLAVPATCGAIGLGLIASGCGATRPVDALMLPVSCLGIAAIASVSRTLAPGRIGGALAATGRASLPIYVLHIFTLPLFMRAVREVPPRFDVAVLLLGTLFGLAASLAIFRAITWADLGPALGLSGGPGQALRGPFAVLRAIRPAPAGVVAARTRL